MDRQSKNNAVRSRIIAVDFDGTLCENKWPEIGEPNMQLIWHLTEQREKYGAKLILWSCRAGEKLDEAVKWCSDRGLIFDAVNENLPDVIEWMGGDTRKIYADEYIDDRIKSPVILPFVEDDFYKTTTTVIDENNNGYMRVEYEAKINMD